MPNGLMLSTTLSSKGDGEEVIFFRLKRMLNSIANIKSNKRIHK